MSRAMTGQMLYNRMLSALEKEGKKPVDMTMRGVIHTFGLEKFKEMSKGMDILPEWLQPYETEGK